MGIYKDKKRKINKNKLAPCPFCDNTNAFFWFTKDGYDLYKCKKCHLIFIYPLPKSTDRVYSQDYFCGAKNGRGYVNYEEDKKSDFYTFNSYLDRIEKIKKDKGKLLDIGAATGSFLEQATKRGWNVSGIEISSYAAEEGRKKGLDIKTGTLKVATFEQDYFDVVTLWDVFEHVRSPQKELESISNILKKDGIMVINLPNSGSLFAKLSGKFWPLLLPPEHIHLFSQKGLIELLKKNRYEILVTDKIGKKFKPAYILQMLSTVRKQKIWKRLSEIIAKTPINKISIPLNLRDNMFIIARKK